MVASAAFTSVQSSADWQSATAPFGNTILTIPPPTRSSLGAPEVGRIAAGREQPPARRQNIGRAHRTGACSRQIKLARCGARADSVDDTMGPRVGWARRDRGQRRLCTVTDSRLTAAAWLDIDAAVMAPRAFLAGLGAGAHRGRHGRARALVPPGSANAIDRGLAQHSGRRPNSIFCRAPRRRSPQHPDLGQPHSKRSTLRRGRHRTQSERWPQTACYSCGVANERLPFATGSSVQTEAAKSFAIVPRLNRLLRHPS
jgi:hypothetical protein